MNRKVYFTPIPLTIRLWQVEEHPPNQHQLQYFSQSKSSLLNFVWIDCCWIQNGDRNRSFHIVFRIVKWQNVSASLKTFSSWLEWGEEKRRLAAREKHVWWKVNKTTEHLHMHLLQSRLSLPCTPVQP